MRILELGAQRSAAHRHNEEDLQHQIKAKRKTRDGPNVANQRVWPHPGAGKTLDRPLTTLSGRRRVPKLVNANRVPFLRLKKPQSPFVSRIIRDIIDTRERRISLAKRLEEQLPLAMHEDEWDKILFDHFGLKESHLWTSELRLAINQNASLQAAAVQKRTDLAARMHAIVEQEKALALEEKLRLRDEKHKQRKARRLARRKDAVPAAEQDKALQSADLMVKAIEPAEKVLQEMKPMVTVPDETMPEVVVGDTKKIQTREGLEMVRAGHILPRSEEEFEGIRAARARRKEDRAKAKANKMKRKAESVQYWQDKLAAQPTYAIGGTGKATVSANKDEKNIEKASAIRLEGMSFNLKELPGP